MKVSEHYNHITNLWPLILGENFHWGYFENENDTLETATFRLIDKMFSMININKNSKLLDVGCGIGEPAIYISNNYLNDIVGISNSQSGIEKASERINKDCKNNIYFLLRDATDNGFPDESFDIIWMLEMSHLIFDKNKLISEAFRTVKKNGFVILCDLMLNKDLTAKDIFNNKDNLLILEKVFGTARLETFDFYKNLFASIGLKNIEFIDISKSVIKTIYLWEEKCYENESKIKELGYSEDLIYFRKSCNILKDFYENGKWGYGIISGQKI
ncbi:MAG TPA: class I SAM-dependent methyltransferase [Ignavibacteriaceae bacterium]|nr:class I SAM-dependent methyltransferase [Ignavibacteriaceae bacterium]